MMTQSPPLNPPIRRLRLECHGTGLNTRAPLRGTVRGERELPRGMNNSGRAQRRGCGILASKLDATGRSRQTNGQTQRGAERARQISSFPTSGGHNSTPSKSELLPNACTKMLRRRPSIYEACAAVQNPKRSSDAKLLPSHPDRRTGVPPRPC
jgi:hypothetical protein